MLRGVHEEFFNLCFVRGNWEGEKSGGWAVSVVELGFFLVVISLLTSALQGGTVEDVRGSGELNYGDVARGREVNHYFS